MPLLSPPTGRTNHYAAFYGAEAVPGGAPLVLVMGNCQAESLRVVLDGAGAATVRVPPVHELTREDLPHLDRLLVQAGALVTQPVRDDYRGLPIGAAQLAARLPPQARVVRFPVIRFAGLYPAHGLVRPPEDPSLGPPVVPYHDLRVLAAAARAAGMRIPLPVLTPRSVRAVAAASVEALRLRETTHQTILASDLFAHPSFEQMRTINHPGNVVWAVVAARVRERLGLLEHDGDPGRPLLNGIHAPREAVVIEALGLDAEPTADWTVNGVAVPVDEVRDAHLRFYAEHPDVVTGGLERHAGTLRLLVSA